MIIECGDCLTKFVVAPAAIGPEGRMVRCAKCQNVWHADPAPEDHEIVPTQVIEKPAPAAEPDLDASSDNASPDPDMDSLTDGAEKLDVAEDDDIPTEDIVGDDGIRGEDMDASEEEDKFEPIDDDLDEDNDLDLDDDEEEGDDINLPAIVPVKSRLIKAAWGLWVLIFFGTTLTFGFAQDWVAKTWPASTVLYDLVGMSDHRPAKSEEGTSDKTKADAGNDAASETANEPEVKKPTREELERAVVITNTFKIEAIGGGRRDLVIDGTLKNTATFDITLPQMKGVLKNSTDENVHEWNFTAVEKIIKAGTTLNFKTVVQRIPADTAAYELFLLWENDQ
jgi:predicted Zn finger-like uncharacterized protein